MVKTHNLSFCAIFAALMAVCAAISIPLPFTPVPLCLSSLGAVMAGGLLGPKYGSLSILVYLLLGAVGLPIFAGFRSGLGILAGPTGGYLIGFIITAAIIGLLTKIAFSSQRIFSNKLRLSLVLFLSIFAATACCYIIGTAWFVYSTKTSTFAALSMCVFPFIPGDILKSFAACILLLRLYPATRPYVLR